MKRVLATALLLCACNKGDDGLSYPIMPGGGGTGGSHKVDAAIDYDANDMIAARVCLIADARIPTTCASSGADGLTVMLGAQMATTAADGTFSITKPTGSGLVWRVSGTGIEPTAMRQGTSTTIPVLTDTVYGEMVSAMSAVITTETGAVIVQATHGGTALAGAVAVSTPAPDSSVYYDGTSSTDWAVDSTHTFGIVWISAIAAGTASIALDNGTVSGSVGGIPVFAGTVTFEHAEIP